MKKILSLVLMLTVTWSAHAFSARVVNVEIFSTAAIGLFKHQQGNLGKNGFESITQGFRSYSDYPDMTDSQVSAVSGRTVMRVAAWRTLEGYLGDFARSTEEYDIDGVPYLIVSYTGAETGGGGALPILTGTFPAAPVALTATLITSQEIETEKSSSYTLSYKKVTRKITNNQLLEYYRSAGYIPGTSGWKIYCYYDEASDGIRFMLRNANGTRLDLSGELMIESVAAVPVGKISVNSKGTVKGSITGTEIDRLVFNYQGGTGVVQGKVSISTQVTGSAYDDEPTFTLTKFGGTLTGYAGDEALVDLKVSGSKFKPL
ncbi:hypothetical protein OpiT1DRAFT_03301 [Opitutaceae bacterium TAV1]|nr:hypothetical protein OpiT1DRAFT_03301 [Opitutaceae bacterium TAV1]